MVEPSTAPADTAPSVDPVPDRHVLFFDFDGTLADSGHGISESMREVFEGVGAPPLSDDEVRLIVGPPFKQTMPVLLASRGIDPSRSDEFIHEYRRVYKEHHLPRTPMIAGMREVVEALAPHWHLAVVTAKPMTQAVVGVRATGLDGHMVTVVGPPDDEPLPKSRLLAQAIDEVNDRLRTSIDVAQCWMIGDRNHDVHAAIEVGTRSAGVLWGFGDRTELVDAGTHVVLADPAELLSLLLPG